MTDQAPRTLCPICERERLTRRDGDLIRCFVCGHVIFDMGEKPMTPRAGALAADRLEAERRQAKKP